MWTRNRAAVRVPFTISLLSLALFPRPLPAQVAQGDTNYHLHGVVLDAVTGKGIGRALVTSMDHRFATMTDSKGQFAFEIATPSNSPDNQRSQGGDFNPSISFSAERPGYSRMDPVAIEFDDTLSTRTTELRLVPAAAITGHVYAPGADAPQNVQVTLLQRAIQNGAFTWRPANSRSTDRSGAFHFGNLQPGEYIVMTPEWRGPVPLPYDLRSNSTQYPPVFLGDASDLKSATPLVLHAGEVANAELHLHSAAYYPVSIPLNGQPAGLSILIGSGLTSGYNLGYDRRHNAIEGSLPNGAYDVHLTTFSAPDGVASAELNIQIAGAALRTAPVTLAPAGNIAVRVHLELTSTSTPTEVTCNLQLQPDEVGVRAPGGNAMAGQTEFAINGVEPGHYWVQPMPSYGYVSRISSGGTDLLEHSLTVSASGGREPIDVTLRDDAATLSGNLQTGDAAAQSRFTVLLLAEGGSRPVQTAFVPNSREFTIGNIAPGSYRLFALSTYTRDFPYRDAKAMLPWLSKGKLITLAPGEKATADAPLVTPPDAVAGESSLGGIE